MKKLLCVLLTACLTFACVSASALTGADALGLPTGEADDDIYGNVGVSSSTSYVTLQVGSRDADDSMPRVVMLQNRLLELGYLSSAADGQYGSSTQQAVVAFQEENGILATGVADATTQAILYSDEAKVNSHISQDTNILRVQQILSQWGFLVGKCDGIAGTGTETAIAEFKSYLFYSYPAIYGRFATPTPEPQATLSPDAQPIVEDVLLSDLEKKADKITVNGFDGSITDEVLYFVDHPKDFMLYQMPLQKGMEGPEVWRLQRKLRQCNYLYSPDGSFGQLTEFAVRYFQRKNGLPETGIADQATQQALFSGNVAFAEEYVFPYKIGVSIDQQRVYVFQWDGSGYTRQVRVMKCSTGMDVAPTPTGTFQSDGKASGGKWYFMRDFNTYVQYAYRIIGGIMFHSVLFNSRKQGPTKSSVNALGRKASHGCIRLAVDDAQWIFENCPEGTTVVIR